MKRTYTGNKDGVAAGEHPQLTALMKELFKAYPKALWNNGSWGVRNMRGKESLSVTATVIEGAIVEVIVIVVVDVVVVSHVVIVSLSSTH